MPPQQRERLLDFGDEVLGFRAHEFQTSSRTDAVLWVDGKVMAAACGGK